MPRIRSALTAAGIVAASAIALATVTPAGAANAAFDPDGALVVNTREQLGDEAGARPASGWYVGDTSTGTISFDERGLVALGTVVVLHDRDASAADLTTLVDGASLRGDVAVSFQLRLDENVTGSGTESTILAPVGDPSTVDPSSDGLWTSSEPFGTIPAGDARPLAEFQTEVAALDAAGDRSADARITAYGFEAGTGLTGYVQAIAFGGQTTYFTPTPSGSLSPSTLALSELRTSGVAVSADGFFPGETVEASLAPTESDSGTPTTVVTFTADDAGSVTGDVVAGTATRTGEYALVLVGAESGISLASTVAVTADVVSPAPTTPVAPPAPIATPVRADAAFTG